MIEITKVDKQHISAIKALAEELWPMAFATILSEKQIAYMMEMMYSSSSIEQQMSEGHEYAIVSKNKLNIGYVSYKINENETNKTKVHKLYILPDYQRNGVGKFILDFVTYQAKEAKNSALFLNVNKYNKQAINFYIKHDFKLIKEEEIDIGNGFIMDDYVYELALT